MNVVRVKYALVSFTILISLLMLLVQFCLFGRQECFPMTLQRSWTKTTKLNSTSVFRMINDLPSSEVPTDEPEEFLALPKGLNQHTWENNCVQTIEALCSYPVYPNAPDKRQVIFKTEILTAPENFGVDGHRLLGYLFPNITGEYYFSVATNGFAEVWLSPNKDWKETKKVISSADVRIPLKKLTFNTSKTQISNYNGTYLRARRRYYVDIVYSLGARNMNGYFLQIAWKRPQETSFEIIEGDYLSLYIDDSDKDKNKVFDDNLPHAHSCTAKSRKGFGNKYMRPETLSYLEHTAVNKTLDFCEYRPSYLLNPAKLAGFGQYHGVYGHAHKIYSFPFPNVIGISKNPRAEQAFIAGNPLDKREARVVVNRYTKALKKAYPG